MSNSVTMKSNMTDFQRDLRLAVLYTICFSVVSGLAELVPKKCFQEDDVTWTCNFVPLAIPADNRHLRLVEFLGDGQSNFFTEERFQDSSFERVEVLELTDSIRETTDCSFASRSFSGFKSLQVLKLSIVRIRFKAFDVFAGLQFVRTLDLSGSSGLTILSLKPQLQKPENLPNLNKLILTRAGIYDPNEMVMDYDFFRTLGTRNITHLEINELQTESVNVTAMLSELPNLTFVNTSYSLIGSVTGENLSQVDLLRLKVLDISYVTASSGSFLPGKIGLSNVVVHPPLVPFFSFANALLLLSPEVMNMSGFLVRSSQSSIWFRNVTIIFDNSFQLFTKKLLVSHNRVKYLDINIVSTNNTWDSLTDLDLSGNEMEMLSPSILSWMPNLQTINLSENGLHQMTERNTVQFTKLFADLKYLTNVDLSKNGITFVPPELFQHNYELKVIDLSANRLKQIHFVLKHLNYLQVLAVRENNIQTLDDMSITYLESIQTHTVNEIRPNQSTSNVSVQLQSSPYLLLQSNPLKCSSCDDKRSVDWSLHAKSWHFYVQQLVCTNEEQATVIIDTNVAADIQNICSRQKNTMALALSGGIFGVLVITLAVGIHRFKKNRRRKLLRRRVMKKIHDGDGQYEFVVFLAYSSNDDEAVSDKVLKPLDETLKQLTGVDRTLVCTGDHDLRPGFRVNDETIQCQERASVVVAVLSDNFLASNYCVNEFYHAYNRRKPIILLVKDRVDETLMPKAVQELFQQNVRILLTQEDGEYCVKPSWDKICNAILDKIEDYEKQYLQFNKIH